MAQLIAEIAQRKPEVAALIDERGETTWADLNTRVNRLISGLRAAGLADGDAVAVMSGNRRELFEVTCAYGHGSWVGVPVNWHWSAEELAYVVGDAGAKALIVEDQFADVALAAAESFDDCPVRIVIGDTAPDGWRTYDELLAAGDPAEPDGQLMGGPMFYTSGTTGFPKGVRSALTSTGIDVAVLSLIAASFAGTLQTPPDGVTLLEGPAYHSAQWVFSMFPLYGAASTIVMRHRFDPAETLDLIDRYGVTNIHLVPTQFIRLLKLPDDVRERFDGGSLETVMHGAAPCAPQVKRDMLAWWGPVVTEYYGGTEGGFLAMIPGDEWLERPGSLGRALDTVELRILDDDGVDCPPGTAGQIWFRSKLGNDFEYHNAPDKTASAHTTDGFGTLGDVGYLDDDGYLFMSDRKIDMIISGGVNIYPAEIEGVLVTHPAVADAAVFGIPDDEMGESVLAAVELIDGGDVPDDLAEVLRAHVRQHLAGYKVPRTVEVVDSLPRTPTGKLLKRQLRDPYWEGTGRSI